MKLASLFAKYLYQHKQLNLPGIGVFQIDPSIPVPEAADKNFSEFIQQIRYVQKPVAAPDETFINFIRTETGKIKPLAESDLDSFLSDGKILLNTGKPFHFEGIGSLLKTRSGTYEFTPGEPLLDRLETYFGEMNDETLKKRSVYEEEYVQQGNGLRKLLIGASILGGIVLIIWGGYSLYNQNSAPLELPINKPVVVRESLSENKLADSAKIESPSDSLIKVKVTDPAIAQPVNADSVSYKFIIEKTSNPVRANKRYNQLKSFYKDIRMETKDSLSYSLYFRLSVKPSDTTKTKNYLKRHYGSKTIYIEP